MRKLIVALCICLFVVGIAYADYDCETITAQNTWTDAIYIRGSGSLVVENVSSMVCTVTLQVKPPGASDWIDIDTSTSAELIVIEHGGGYQWRAGVKTGGYTSGTTRICIEGY